MTTVLTPTGRRVRVRRRAAAVLLTVTTSGVLISGVAQAASGNPHFIASQTSASLSGTSLVVQFKEAGLPSGATETVTTSADVTTVYECVNNGGQHPQASNKASFNTAVSTSGTFTADRSGNIVGTETLTVPSASSLGFSCPGGQTVTLVSVSYTDVMVTDTTSGATISLPGTFTYTNPAAPPVSNH